MPLKKVQIKKVKRKSPKTPRSKTSTNLNLRPKKSSTVLGQKRRSPKGKHSPSLIDPIAQNIGAQIAQRAHELYAHRGRVHGYDFADWLKAEREIMGEMSRS